MPRNPSLTCGISVSQTVTYWPDTGSSRSIDSSPSPDAVPTGVSPETPVGGQTSLAAYVTSERPTGVSGLSPVGTASGDGELSVDLDEPVSGPYVTVWLSLLPQVSDGYRGTISEVQVRG